jgi:hypothetical protein
MADVKYRVYLENKPAKRAQLDLIQEITVEQAIDASWEARLLMYICTDDQGNWTDSDPAFGPHMRVRVEIDPGNGTFTPLIDGPITGIQPSQSSQPGESTQTIIVGDDTVLLNTEEVEYRFQRKLDHEIAAELFEKAGIHHRDIDQPTPPPAGGLVPDEFQNSSAMHVLRKIAARQGMHAYVLPGKDPGASVGVFKRLPTQVDSLPPLVLLGANRNFDTWTAMQDHQLPASVEAYSLSVTDKVVSHAIATFRDIQLLGPKPVADSTRTAAKRLLPAGLDGAVDAKTAVEAATAKLSFATQASGTTIRECYQAVLSPYRAVLVTGVKPKDAGVYVIKSVTHRLTRSIYEQSFQLIRNALSEVEVTVTNEAVGAIF